jgi:membrane protease YdiL (CAAX protease family)
VNGSPEQGGRWRLPLEALGTTTAALAAVVVLSRATTASWLLVPVAWAAAALTATALARRPWAGIGLRLPDIRRFVLWMGVGLAAAAGVAALALARRWWGLSPPLLPRVQAGQWPAWVVYQLLYIAASEELFFRGYLQGVLAGWFAVGRPPGASAQVGAVACASAAFALAHAVVLADPVALVVFLPGLLFGWVRWRTDSLLTAVLLHGACNVGYAAGGWL